MRVIQPGVDVVHDPLVVLELSAPLPGRVVAEVVAERHEEHARLVQLRLLAVLVQQRLGPLRDVELVDLLGRDPPGAGGDAAGEAVEVELAADLGVGAAGVGHVVAVEGHHVRQHVRAVLVVPVLQGTNSVEIFWLEFWLEKSLEFWLVIPRTKKMFKNG